jgi:hypothetical protein
MKVSVFILLVVLTYHLFPTASKADYIDILVPAYANPASAGGPFMWNNLISTASDSSRNYNIHVIFNPASGPGSARDQNYLDSITMARWQIFAMPMG